MIEIHHRPDQIGITDVRQQWTVGSTGCNYPRAIFPYIDLAVHIANTTHDLRVRGIHMKGFAKGFLRDFPIAGHHFGRVGLFVQTAKVPTFKLFCQILDKVIKRIAVLIRVDKNKPSPNRQRYFRQRKITLVDLREVPIRRDIF